MFSPTRPRCYAIATTLTSGTGAEATNAVRDAIRRMFEETDALIIEAAIAHENKASKRVASMVGLVEIGGDDATSLRKLTIAAWLRSNQSAKAEAKRPAR